MQKKIVILSIVGLLLSAQSCSKRRLVPAALLQQEASICGIEGMVAVANVYQRNKNWRLLDNVQPSNGAILVSNYWFLWPGGDTSNGAKYLWSRSDVQLKLVQDIIHGQDLKLLSHIQCRGGELYGYG